MPRWPGVARSGERALPGDVPADDERLDLSGSFVGDQGLHIAQMAHDVEVERDAVATKDVAGNPTYIAALDRAVVLGQRGHRLFDLALVDEPTQTDGVQLHRGEIPEHLDQHRLDDLGPGDRF